MITTDTGAKKIEGTDNWRQIFGAHNDTVDAYDANIEALQGALGIVVNGNQSAVSASSGQFIILKNSSIVDSGDVMLADGLYTAAKAIPANTVIDKTYLTADAAGGLNALNGNLETLSSKVSSLVKTKTFSGTPSANGNLDLSDQINPSKNIILQVSCRGGNSTSNTTSLIATPYRYNTGNGGTAICGIHVTSDSSPFSPHTSGVWGKIYYLEY